MPSLLGCCVDLEEIQQQELGRRKTQEELADGLRDTQVKGEIVLLVEPPEEQEASEEDVDRMLREALATEKPSQAAAKVAKATGADRKALYARALELRE